MRLFLDGYAIYEEYYSYIDKYIEKKYYKKE